MNENVYKAMSVALLSVIAVALIATSIRYSQWADRAGNAPVEQASASGDNLSDQQVTNACALVSGQSQLGFSDCYNILKYNQ